MNRFLSPSYRSTIQVLVENPNYNIEEFLFVIAKELEKEGAYEIVVTGNSISFSGRSGIFNLKPVIKMSFFRSRPLNAIGTGCITLEQQPDFLSLTYELGFSEMLIFATIVILGIAIFMQSVGSPLQCTTTVAVVGWLWITLGSIVYSVFWFKYFLNRCTTKLITN